MTRECKITDRKALVGNKRSHAMNASKRKFNLNLQKVTILDEKNQKITFVGSTKGIKTKKREIELKKKQNTIST